MGKSTTTCRKSMEEAKGIEYLGTCEANQFKLFYQLSG